MYFWIWGLPQTRLDNCLRSAVSEDPLTSNMLNRPKNYSKLNDGTFTKFIDLCEGNSDLIGLSEWYAKFQDCLLIHLLPVITTLFLKEGIYCNIFRCLYLRNEKYVLNLFFAFSKFRFIVEHFGKKDDSHIRCIFELTDFHKHG